MDAHAVGRREDNWNWGDLHAVCLRETRRVLGTTALSEDAAQEAVLRAWRRRRQCLTPGVPGPWVAAIARREALRVVRARAEVPLPEHGPATVDRRLEQTEARVDVARALRGLEPGGRALLHARYWRDLTQAEAAVVLGIPEGTAKVRLHRLRAHLAEALHSP